MPTTTVIAGEQQQLPAAGRPERAAVAELDEVVEEADRAAARRVTKRTVSAGSVYCESARNGSSAQSRISRPPITGVPCLTTWPAGPSSRIVLAELVPAQELDELRADDDRDDHRDQAGDQDADHLRAVRFASAGAMPSSPTARDALTSTASPGRTSVAQPRRAPLAASGTQRVGAVAARELADREHVDPELGGERRRPRGGSAARPRRARPCRRGRRPAAAARALARGGERGAHRGRVRVVGVVDDEAAAGERQLLAAPARDRDAAAPSSARSSGRPSAS